MYPRLLYFGRHQIIWAILLLVPASAGAEPISSYEQRALYKSALDALTAGQTTRFREAQQQLSDYVLAPYLAYHELQSRLSSASANEIRNFQTFHGDLPAAKIIHYRWLRRLGNRREWRTFLDNYADTSDAELNCFRLRALYGTGERAQAFAEVPELWMVAKSQPKACDPLFDVWISNDQLTERMVWTRLKLALEANGRTLARYLQRFFKGSTAQLATAYYNVHVTPSNITRTNRYRTDSAYARDVVRHGLIRLSRRDPAAAKKAWRVYRRSDAFSDEDSQLIDTAIAIGFARDGSFPDPADTIPTAAAPDIALAAITIEDWAQAAHWIDRIGGEERLERRWQYWLARSLAGSVLHSDRAQLTFTSLAMERDYYGFLAAEQIGTPMRMNNEPLALTPAQINQLRRQPAVARAIELYAVGDLINARREWRDLLPALSDEDRAAAAALAQSIGWITQGIRTASAPSLHNTLVLRFPLAYEDTFQKVAHTTDVARSFLQAIARQESAYDPRARSSANARGLMQLMHPTANGVARRIGVTPPSVAELYDPSVNVELAGHHLAALLDRYDRQRPLAAAAYNAGESRVERWTKNRSGMAMDVWIEIIPFRETRNYVKNVLAFDQVYSHLLGSPVPMLKVHETSLQ